MARRITVSELKCAVVDPQWRAKWLAGKTPSTLTFGPNRSGKVYGTRFHQVAAALARWLTAPSQLAGAARINDVDALFDVAWRLTLQDITDQLLADGDGGGAVAFTECVRAYCGRLIELRHRAEAFENWQDVFVFTEEPIENVSVAVGAESVGIAGRVDAVRFHPHHQLEIVDYKLSQGAQQKSDLIQLAIYAHLLPLWRPGASFCGTLEYYLPQFKEMPVSPQELRDIYADLVAPVLTEMFAPKPPKQMAKAAPTSPPVPPPPPSSAGAADLGEKIVAAFRSYGLGVDIAGVIEGPQVRRVKLKPASGVKVASLANRAADLQVALALDEPPLIKPGRGYVIFDMPRADRETMPLRDYLRTARSAADAPVSFPVGVGVEGEPLVADFCDSNTCHVLVAGTSGSGKSEWLKSLVANLALRNSFEQLRLALIDPKILTFSNVDKSPYLWRQVATNIDEALEILSAAVAEMEARYGQLAKEGFLSVSDRFKAGRREVPFIVIVFDEFADLILTGGDKKRRFEEMVARLAGKGRAAGLHLVLATQRPDRNVVTGLIRSNLPMKVCLRVANAINSQIVLDEPGAESLLGKGDLLCDMGKGIVRAQSYFVPQDSFIKAIKAAS